jgi:hypothetical protein
MAEFPHLPLPNKIQAGYKYKKYKFEKKVAEQTAENLQNRINHGRTLKQTTNRVKREWNEQIEDREILGLPDLPDKTIIPIFLQVDPADFDAESLYSFGIEVIAEEESGFIIGAAADNFISLKDKIDKFINAEGKFKNTASRLWNITVGTQWKLDHILSPELNAKWDLIPDDQEMLVDIGIACYLKISNAPSKKPKETARGFKARYQRWLQKKQRFEEERAKLEEQRQFEFTSFINESGGNIVTSFVGNSDSFSCRIRVDGKTLKDLVLNYQYLFDVSEYDEITFANPVTRFQESLDVEFTPPTEDSPKICVIDSGIQENHLMIADAVFESDSRVYFAPETSVADAVANGGHGTKVAGCVLFGNSIPKFGRHEHTFWVQNARVLNRHKLLPQELYPPELMETIVEHYDDTKIFNLSINSTRPCQLVHMSAWGATIDKLSEENDLLFIISTGNLFMETGIPTNPGVRDLLLIGNEYPGYLFRKATRIANPAQSCFALSVGSVCVGKFEDEDRESFGEKDQPSGFTRTGPGIWDMIKPDVVEYGGDFVHEKSGDQLITVMPECSVEVIRSTTSGNNAIGYDVGSSFAAPKVAHIAGKILNLLPVATANTIRALIAQGARLPFDLVFNPTVNSIQSYGYGIANKLRSTQNYRTRITLMGESKIRAKQAEVYTIRIPESMRDFTEDFDILIEVSMAFQSIPRRTRRTTKSYLSIWVDWESSKFQESYARFKSRVLKYVEADINEEGEESTESMPWKIRGNVGHGDVKGLRRQDSSLQKDWAIVKSYQMPEEFSIAVVGHPGWEKDLEAEVSYSIAVSFEVLNANINVYDLVRIENKIEVEAQVRVKS